jgi:hypothetical protein
VSLLISSADGTCRVWGLSDAARARDVEDGVEIPIAAAVMPHAQYIGASLMPSPFLLCTSLPDWLTAAAAACLPV